MTLYQVLIKDLWLNISGNFVQNLHCRPAVNILHIMTLTSRNTLHQRVRSYLLLIRSHILMLKRNYNKWSLKILTLDVNWWVVKCVYLVHNQIKQNLSETLNSCRADTLDAFHTQACPCKKFEFKLHPYKYRHQWWNSPMAIYRTAISSILASGSSLNSLPIVKGMIAANLNRTKANCFVWDVCWAY